MSTLSARYATLLLAMWWCTACTADDTPSQPQEPPPDTVVATLQLSPDQVELRVGASVSLEATVRNAAGDVLAGKAVAFTSSDGAVATVDDAGTVTAAGAGTAQVSATSQGVSSQASVTVLPPPVATVLVSPDSAKLVVDSTLQLSVTAQDAQGGVLQGRRVTFATSNNLVATVDSTGLVFGEGLGTATVTATVEGKVGMAVIDVIEDTVKLSQFTFVETNEAWMRDYSVMKAVNTQDEVYAWMRHDDTRHDLIAAFGWSDLEWRLVADLEGYKLVDMAISPSASRLGGTDPADNMMIIRKHRVTEETELMFLNGPSIDISRLFWPPISVAIPAGEGEGTWFIYTNDVYQPSSSTSVQQWDKRSVAGEQHSGWSTLFPGSRDSAVGYAVGRTVQILYGDELLRLLKEDGTELNTNADGFAYDWGGKRGFFATHNLGGPVWMHENTGGNVTVTEFMRIHDGGHTTRPPDLDPAPYTPLSFQDGRVWTVRGKYADPTIPGDVRGYLTRRPLLREPDFNRKVQAWDQLYGAKHLFKDPTRPGLLYFKRSSDGDPDRVGGWLYYQIVAGTVPNTETGLWVDPWRPYK